MSIVDSVHSAAVAVQNHIAEQVSKKNEQTQPAKTETADASESTTDAVELTDKGSKAVENGVGEVVSADDPETDEEEKTPITINGTDGNDTIDVTILKDGSYSLVVNGEETTYTAEEAERLVINGGDGDDTINIHQEAFKKGGEIVINGGDGNDIITGDEKVTTALTIDGGKGDDRITGGSGNDIITDNYGSNYIDGGKGKDEITAMGSDYNTSWWSSLGRVFGLGNERPENTIIGGDGSDVITTGEGVDHITGGAGDDVIDAGAGNDVIDGGDGDDIIYGGDGNDTVRGGAGRDYIEGNHGDDTIYGGDDADVIYAGKGNDYVSGGAGDDFVNAGKGDDEVHGGSGNDTLFGLSGNDVLYGGLGDDTVVAGEGHDKVSGGSGDDTIRVTSSWLHGTDEVVGGLDEGDDYKVLNSIDVPNNFKMCSGQSERFTERVEDDLQAFAAIEPGQELLTQYAATGKTMYFKEISDLNSFAAETGEGDASANITYNEDGTRNVTYGSGRDSIIKLNPALIDLNGKEAWAEANNMVILAHEMSHAYNNAMGNKDNSFYNNETGERVDLPESTTSEDGWKQRAIRGAEQQAVGMFDGSNVAPNPYGISENDYRAYFHMPLRDSYQHQTATQHTASVDAGNAIPEEYQDYKY